MLTHIIQHNPKLNNIKLIILNKFHKHNLQTNLTLTLLLNIQQNLHNNLKLLIISTTLNNNHLQQILPKTPIIISKKHSFPIKHHYLPLPTHQHFNNTITITTTKILHQKNKSLLLFLPNIKKIQHIQKQLTSHINNNILLYPLYNTLSLNNQQKTILPTPQKIHKIILTTNITKTNLTIKNIHLIINYTQKHITHFNPHTKLTQLITQHINQTSITQHTKHTKHLKPNINLHLITKKQTKHTTTQNKPKILQNNLSNLLIKLLQ